MSIKLIEITKSYEDKVILNNISLEVQAGEAVAIVGFSGTGKSTILKIISGLTAADSGEVVLGDKNIGMAFQYSALFDSLDVFENVAFALKERNDFKNRYTENQLRAIVKEKLELVGLADIEDKFPSELSGGMQKRVSFARAIVTDPKIILYDEPTAGLDPVSSTVIEDYIVRLKKELNAASVIVTHQMSTITRTADKVIMLYNGGIVWQGTPFEFISSNDPYAYQFVNAQKEGPMLTAGN